MGARNRVWVILGGVMLLAVIARLLPGPRTIDGVEKLAALLHPMTATR